MTFSFDYIGWRRPAYAFSLLLLLGAFGFTAARGGINWGLDFAGGTSVVVKFGEPVTPEFLGRLRAGLGDLGRNIRSIGAAGEEAREVSVDIRGGGYVDEQANVVLRAREAGRLASPADLAGLFPDDPPEFRAALVDIFSPVAGPGGETIPAAYDLAVATASEIRNALQSLFNEGIAGRVRARLLSSFGASADAPDANRGDASSLARALAAVRSAEIAEAAAAAAPFASLEDFFARAGAADADTPEVRAALTLDTAPAAGRASVNGPPDVLAEILAGRLERLFAPAAAAIVSAREERHGGLFPDVEAAASAADAAGSSAAARLLRARFIAAPFAIVGTETVGPAVGADLRRAAITATAFSLLGLVLYVAWRFELRFAVAGVACTFHDVLFIVGFIGATGIEFDIPIVAAILTVAGYSINDTIVVFDRIRERLGTMRREGLPVVINTAISDVLVRSLMTGVTTMIAVTGFYLWGPTATRGLNLAILAGIVVGTYSSIFVAAPLLVEWEAAVKALADRRAAR